MNISIINNRRLIQSVLRRWNEQYSKRDDNATLASGDKVSEIRARLIALDLNRCSVEDVNKAIGTEGWASERCDCCDEYTESGVIFTDPYGDDNKPVCLPCLKAAVAMAEAK